MTSVLMMSYALLRLVIFYLTMTTTVVIADKTMHTIMAIMTIAKGLVPDRASKFSTQAGGLAVVFHMHALTNSHSSCLNNLHDSAMN